MFEKEHIPILSENNPVTAINTMPEVHTNTPLAVPLGTTLLEVEDATVRFGKFVAVRKASFQLRAGSLLGLIGPNGAGKTTLLRVIASLQPMTSGTIKILGNPVLPG